MTSDKIREEEDTEGHAKGGGHKFFPLRSDDENVESGSREGRQGHVSRRSDTDIEEDQTQ